jgi:hypothetical protein
MEAVRDLEINTSVPDKQEIVTEIKALKMENLQGRTI